MSPRRPRLSTCSLRMTSMVNPRASVRDVRDQRELARALDRRLQLPLVRRARPGDPPRLDLAALRDERREQPDVLVVDVVDLLRAELADPAAAEEAAARLASLALFLVLVAAPALAPSSFPHRWTSAP